MADYGIHKRFKVDNGIYDKVIVEVDHNGWDGDHDVYLELIETVDQGVSVLTSMSPKKARKIGKALIKAAKKAKAHE